MYKYKEYKLDLQKKCLHEIIGWKTISFYCNRFLQQDKNHYIL